MIRSVLATDCGSTTTKAILIERVDGEYRLVQRGEAPTTVEAPFEDVTIGIRNAVAELEELTGRRLLDGGGVVRPQRDGRAGVDRFVSTSSAGGGLQMLVAGVVRTMTAESAQRAALGAGAIVMDVVAVDDGRLPHEKIQRIRSLRPDMVLLSGGVDGGTVSHVVELAELLAAADPKPRLGMGFRLPVVYAGNVAAREHVRRILGGRVDLRVVDNLRPTLEQEVLGPAREEVHNLFMEHVMAQAPGYHRLLEWVDAPVMPTPAAVGLLIEQYARRHGLDVMGVDIGGATTDVFSVFGGVFTRTVSANLGMSYSISNVLAEAGAERIVRWLPFPMAEGELRHRIRNKTIRPTTIPQTLEDLALEHAVAREALRLAYEHHKSLARGLVGVKKEADVAAGVEQRATGETRVDPMALDLVIGSGGVLSHAPRRQQAALMLLDAFQPQGVTRLAVDSIFMMPHLGVLSTVHPEAAAQVFDRDCLVRLGTAVAPVQRVERVERGAVVATVRYSQGGRVHEHPVRWGEIARVELAEGVQVEAEIRPARGFDVGGGPGGAVRAVLEGGVVGLILDGRGRPLVLPAGPERAERLLAWCRALDLYPEAFLRRLQPAAAG